MRSLEYIGKELEVENQSDNLLHLFEYHIAHFSMITNRATNMWENFIETVLDQNLIEKLFKICAF